MLELRFGKNSEFKSLTDTNFLTKQLELREAFERLKNDSKRGALFNEFKKECTNNLLYIQKDFSKLFQEKSEDTSTLLSKLQICLQKMQFYHKLSLEIRAYEIDFEEN